MGEEPEEIARDIEETRDSLGEKVDALAGQLKESVTTARNRAFKIAGITAAAVVGILTLRRLRRRGTS